MRGPHGRHSEPLSECMDRLSVDRSLCLLCLPRHHIVPPSIASLPCVSVCVPCSGILGARLPEGPFREHCKRATCYSTRAALFDNTCIPLRCFEGQGSVLPGAASYSFHWSDGQRGQYVATLRCPSALGSLICPHVCTCVCVLSLLVQCERRFRPWHTNDRGSRHQRIWSAGVLEHLSCSHVTAALIEDAHH